MTISLRSARILSFVGRNLWDQAGVQVILEAQGNQEEVETKLMEVDRSDAFVPGAIREPGSNLLVNREIVEPGFDSVAADKACDKDDAEQRRVSLPLSQPPLRLGREPRSSELKGGILL